MSPPHLQSAIRTVRLIDLAPQLQPSIRQQIETIFWETVATPPPDAERAAFQDLWFGQYLRLDPALVFVALNATNTAAGYLVGSLDNPAASPRFASLTYFQAFKDACARYPAQLHINLTASWRGQGVGQRLIDAFAADVRARGAKGFHVVTGADARNVSFYTRAGFREIARTSNARGRAVVFLSRDA